MLIGLDPGRNVGIAYVHEDGTLERGEVVLLEELPYINFPAGSLLILGDGTGSGNLAEVLKARAWSFELVDERGTSLEARELYFSLYPPPWWMRLLPRGLWVPPRQLDDFAAYAIVLRYLGKKEEGAQQAAPLKDENKSP